MAQGLRHHHSGDGVDRFLLGRLLDEYTDGCGTDMQGYVATNKWVAKKNAISFDAEKHAFSMWGVNAMEIPGMSLGALAVLMGKRIHRKVHVGQEFLQVVQPGAEQQDLRRQTSLEQGAEAEEQSRTGV